MGGLAFLSPWFLLALIILPVLWQIVRFTPPAPRRIAFPAIKLLKFLQQKEDTPRRAPWWLLLLRLLIVVLVILAAAQPVLNPERALGNSNSVLLVINNDWASAKDWPRIESEAENILAAATRLDKKLQIAVTAPDPEAPFDLVTPVLQPAQASQIVKSLRPLPWPARYDLLAAQLSKTELISAPDIFWLGNGVGGEGFTDVLNKLRDAGKVSYYVKADLPLAWLSARPKADNKIELQLRRSAILGNPLPALTYRVQAFGEDGRVLGQKEVSIPANENGLKADLEMPLELKNKVGSLAIEMQSGAGATYLLDETGRQHPVGIVSTQAMDSSKPLLDELYFIERAIGPFAEIYHGNLDEILKSNVAVIILTDANHPGPLERDQLDTWVKEGGMLIRFGGENMVKDKDTLTPVPVREAPRNLTGNLSWSEPLSLAPMPERGPFAGLAVPADIKIMKQILSAPTQDLAEKSWALLQDGTPLVTGETRGKGTLVLFHVAANSAWSNLVLSGLFVEMLQRLVWASQGIAANTAEGTLSPFETLDGFGQLQSPPAYAKSIGMDEIETRRVSPSYPPGYYGASGSKKAFNLTDHMPVPEMIAALPQDVRVIEANKSKETDLRPYLYLLALLLALGDSMVSLNLRGFIPNWRAGSALLILLAIAAPAKAENNIDAARSLRLAYVKSFVPEIDRVSEAGLNGLAQILRARTAVDVAAPVGVNIEQDELAFYPLLYWPLGGAGNPLSQGAVRRIDSYIKNGGMIVIDTREGSGGMIEAGALSEKFQNVDLPPLSPIGKDHVLTRSFYLLKVWPGRWNDQTLWVSDSENSSFDGVSPVIVGTQDWAAAWAVDKAGKPIFPATPGGESQREMARRFGVNLVMYALTGNYKSDQVHVPAILERLGHE